MRSLRLVALAGIILANSIAPLLASPESQVLPLALRYTPAEEGRWHEQEGQRLFQHSDFAGAAAEFQEALRLCPNNSVYHHRLAVAHRRYVYYQAHKPIWTPPYTEVALPPGPWQEVFTFVHGSDPGLSARFIFRKVSGTEIGPQVVRHLESPNTAKDLAQIFDGMCGEFGVAHLRVGLRVFTGQVVDFGYEGWVPDPVPSRR